VVKHVYDKNKVNAESHVTKHQLGHEIFLKQKKIRGNIHFQILMYDAKAVPAFFRGGGNVN
jgi:hypothetical protein